LKKETTTSTIVIDEIAFSGRSWKIFNGVLWNYISLEKIQKSFIRQINPLNCNSSQSLKNLGIHHST
jgi:hypothetical protein